MNDEEFEERRRKLDEALASKRPREPESEQGGKGSASGYAMALRLSSEFIAGILVGTWIGWLFDRFLGSSPWGLIVFLLLGFAAGVLNVLRSAGMVAEPEDGRKAPDRRDEN